MNNAQLDMVLGYLNEGTEIDTIEFLYESLNEELNNMLFEDVEVVNEKLDIKAAKEKLISAINTIIEKIKQFVGFVKTKILSFIKAIKTKVSAAKTKAIGKKVLEARKNKKVQTEAVSSDELEDFLAESIKCYPYEKFEKIRSSVEDNIDSDDIFEISRDIRSNNAASAEDYFGFSSMTRLEFIEKYMVNIEHKALVNFDESRVNAIISNLERTINNCKSEIAVIRNNRNIDSSEISSTKDFLAYGKNEKYKEKRDIMTKANCQLAMYRFLLKYYKEFMADYIKNMEPVARMQNKINA